MDFKLQAFGPFLHLLTLIVLCVVPLLIAYVIYRLGSLPGEVARARHHPHADAVAICGWMGLITLVLWPLALVWAYLALGELSGGGMSAERDGSIKTLTDRLHDARQRLAALQSQPPQQRVAAGE